MNKLLKSWKKCIPYILVLCFILNITISPTYAFYQKQDATLQNMSLATPSNAEIENDNKNNLEDKKENNENSDVLFEKTTRNILIDKEATPSEIEESEATPSETKPEQIIAMTEANATIPDNIEKSYSYGIQNTGTTDAILGTKIELDLDGVTSEEITVTAMINNNLENVKTLVAEEPSSQTAIYYLETADLPIGEKAGYFVTISSTTEKEYTITGSFSAMAASSRAEDLSTSKEIFESTDPNVSNGLSSDGNDLINAKAEFDKGKNFNSKIKTLAGGLDNISSIVRTYSKPNLSEMTDANIVSSAKSSLPIYAWFDNGEIKLWSESQQLRFNNNCEEMFYRLSKVVKLDLSSYDVSNMTTATKMFYGCTNLETLDVSGWKTDSLSFTDNMFYDCRSLVNLDVSSWNTSKISKMESMFYNCNSLKYLDVSNWNLTNVVFMDNAFMRCSALKELDTSNWYCPALSNLSGTFSQCQSLKVLDLSNLGCYITNGMNIQNSFVYCTALEYLDLSGIDFTNMDEWTLEYIKFNGTENIKTAYAKDSTNCNLLNKYGKPSTWSFSVKN